MALSQRKQARTARAATSRRLHILITAGPTREHFDSVRFISNPSSGKMGYAIAEAAVAAGHRVTLVSGPVSLRPPPRATLIRVVSAAEMAAAAKRAFVSADAAIFTAAVCDYRPRRRAARKLAKQPKDKTVVLLPTQDIAATLGRRKGRRVTIAFAMEDHDARAHAEAKLRRKHCDAIVLNGPENVGSDQARVAFLVEGGRWEQWQRAGKLRIAERLITRVERLIAQRLPGRD
ncbi:MAG: phosphopantothenoylcysteine decarboxylase [Phycisphaerae bacterium]